MTRQIFVNLAVSDLDKSKAFFEALGFSFNPQFTDENAACMVISETIYSMLLTRDYFTGFSPNPPSDPRQQNEVMIALSCESRGEVDQLVSKAVEAGGKTFNDPADHGFMYQHAFQDLDGHVWELIWMDPATVQS
ncbi:VOC family protein [Gilvimarinus sp. F26214L]|uniref:VOC family protein n=1 Tax=Gilvimarinus sp. DZF01 TaxID=3461371 RepID=UPI0040455A04